MTTFAFIQTYDAERWVVLSQNDSLVYHNHVILGNSWANSKISGSLEGLIYIYIYIYISSFYFFINF
jgi:hypothetical protein